jgi:hypothetical protein
MEANITYLLFRNIYRLYMKDQRERAMGLNFKNLQITVRTLAMRHLVPTLLAVSLGRGRLGDSAKTPVIEVLKWRL